MTFAEQIEVDWAGDPAQIIDPDTGEIIPAFLFVGVMTYSQYPFVEAFINEKQRAWITAHVHMYEYFGGVTRILVPDNTTTAVLHNNDWYNQELNTIYHEMAEHYNTAIIPARVRAPKDKPNAEGSVGVISTWITAALRNEQFFSLAELNKASAGSWRSSYIVRSKRKRVPDTRSSATKNCHYWPSCRLPPMNWRNGKKPPFNLIITYPSTECYTPFLTNSLNVRWMCG